MVVNVSRRTITAVRDSLDFVLPNQTRLDKTGQDSDASGMRAEKNLKPNIAS